MRRTLPALIASGLLVFLACDESVSTAPENGAPVVADVTLSVAKNGSVSEVVPATDPDGDPLSFSLAASPTNGVVTIEQVPTGVAVTYTPSTGFSGSDAFTFSASDGRATAQARVGVTVLNSAPTGLTAGTFVRSRSVASAATVEVTGTDPDGDSMAFRVQRGPRGGTVGEFSTTTRSEGSGTVTTGRAVYRALPGFDDSDDFDVIATDGTAEIGPVTVRVEVNGVPVAEDVQASTRRGVPVSVQLRGQDPNGDALAFRVTSSGSGGSVSPTSGTLTDGVAFVTFTPDPDFAGEASIAYVVEDEFDTSAPARAQVSVLNDRPVANPVSVTAEALEPVTVELSGSDPDGDPLTFALAGSPTGATFGPIVATGPTTATITVTPNEDTPDQLSFRYVADDGATRSAAARVTIDFPVRALALVLNAGDYTVSLINRGTGEVQGTLDLSVNFLPPGTYSLLAISPDGTKAMAGYNPDVIDLAGQRLVAGEPVVRLWFLAFTPDGTRVYATGGVDPGGFPTPTDLYIINPVSGVILEQRDLEGDPIGAALAISPDGTRVWITGENQFGLAEFDVATGARIRTLALGTFFRDATLSPDGSRLYANTLTDMVEVDLVTGALDVIAPAGIARTVFHPDGTRAFISVAADNEVLEVDVATRTITRRIPMGGEPRGIAVTPDGEQLYVANRLDDTVSIVDIASGAIVDTIAVGDAPTNVVIGGR